MCLRTSSSPILGLVVGIYRPPLSDYWPASWRVIGRLITFAVTKCGNYASLPLCGSLSAFLSSWLSFCRDEVLVMLMEINSSTDYAPSIGQRTTKVMLLFF